MRIIRLNLEDMQTHNVLISRSVTDLQKIQSVKTAKQIANMQLAYKHLQTVLNQEMKQQGDLVKVTIPLSTLVQIKQLLESVA